MDSRPILITGLVMLLAACAHYTLLEPQPQMIDEAFHVEPQIQWSRTVSGHIELWTVDGPTLQAVRFYKGLQDGENLFRYTGSEDDTLPVYRTPMTANDIMEFYVDSLIAAKRLGLRVTNWTGSRFETEGLRPVYFEGQPGFRFEVRFLAANGLEYEGFVVGTQIDQRLYLIVYSGAREFYYPRYKDAAEKLVASIRLAE